MDKNTPLKQLYQGALKKPLYRIDTITENSLEYIQANEEYTKKLNNFYPLLPLRGQEMFDELEEERLEVESVYNYECFAYGFKLATFLLATTDISTVQNLIEEQL